MPNYLAIGSQCKDTSHARDSHIWLRYCKDISQLLLSTHRGIKTRKYVITYYCIVLLERWEYGLHSLFWPYEVSTMITFAIYCIYSSCVFLNPFKEPVFKETWSLHGIFITYLHKTNTPVVTILDSIMPAKLFPIFIITRIDIFGYVIYSSTDAHCNKYVSAVKE